MKSEVRQGWLDEKEIFDGDIIMFFLSRNEVEITATYRLENQINELKKAGIKAKNSLVISFAGYDNDPREVYQIPEIQKYLRTLFKKVPELFYFVEIKSYTFAILLNAIFVSQAEVKMADIAVTDYAKSIGDTGRVISVSYYAAHHMELINE